jgi:hypothetical protein
MQCEDFLHSHQGRATARQAGSALIDSMRDRDTLREFVRRREVDRQELRGEWRGCSASPGRRPARDLWAVALRPRTPPPRRCPASAGRRYRPQRSRSAAPARMSRAVLLAPGSLSPCKITAQGRLRRVAGAMAQAPPLTMIFPGKTSAAIGEDGEGGNYRRRPLRPGWWPVCPL